MGETLVVVQTLYLRLLDSELSVPQVSLKCQEQLDSEEMMVLTDVKGQELLDSSGTQGMLQFKEVINNQPSLLRVLYTG
jgi:hypothetical protein